MQGAGIERKETFETLLKMKQFPTIILFYIIIPVFIWGCNNSSTSRVDNEFALYSTQEIFDSINNSYKLVPAVDHYITIQDDDDLLKTVNILLDSISKNSFHHLNIEALRIEEKDSGSKLLIINLLENENINDPDSLGHYRTWYDFFQGTMGGEVTSIILRESILQRNYKGEWIDEMQVYYQNEPIGQWDHIQLDGTILRN